MVASLLGVLAMNLFFLPPVNSLLVVLSIIMVIVELLGWMALFRTQLNVASLVNIILAIGFTWTTPSHITHIAVAFSSLHLSSLPSADRAIHALVE